MVNFLRIRTLVLLVVLFALANIATAQVASKYSFSQASGTYTPITGGTSLATATGSSLAASLDDFNYTLASGTIPFAFPFNGNTYTGLIINSNGYITFGATAPSTGLYTPLSSGTGYAGAVSAIALDLNSLYTSLDTGNISYVARGTTPNQEFVIQYKNFRPYNTSTGIIDYWRWNFQIILHENGVINVVYDLGFAGAPTASAGEVGLRGPNNTFATNVNNRRVVSGTHTWVTSVNGISNASTAAFSTTLVPPSGHNYIYTPVTNNIQVKSLLTPVAANCLGTTENVTVRVVNLGIAAVDLSVDPLNVSATVSGTLNQTISTSVNTGTIAVGDSLTVNVGTLNLSSGGVFNFVIAGKRTGDQQIADDTLKTSVTTLTIAALPVINPFTGFTGANLTTVQSLWREGAGATLPAGTTSLWTSATGLGGAGNVTAKINLSTTTRNEWIVGPLINVGANDSLSVDVAVTDAGSIVNGDLMGSDDKVAIMVTTDCGASWAPLYSFTAANNLTTSLTKYGFSLSAYAGQKIGLAFLATDGPLANAEAYDFHIDNVNIFSAGQDLVSPVVVSATNSPSGNQCATVARTVSVSVTDAVGVKEVTLNPSFGGTAQTAVVLSLSSGTAQNGVWTGTIPAAGNNVAVTFTVVAKDTANNISATLAGTGYSDGNLGAVIAGPDQTVSQGDVATLSAASNATVAGLRFTEITQNEVGTGQTPAYPSYMTGDDYVEITNLGTQSTLLDNIKLNVVGGTTVSFTFPAGVVVAPNEVVVVNLGAGTNNLANRYFNTGGSNDVLSSGTPAGYYLSGPNGTVLDAVATSGYTFLVATGVTTSDWSGNIASSTGFAGVRRTVAADNNLASDWTISSASNLQNIGTLNAGLNSITVTPAIVWNPGAVTANPYTTPVFNTTGVFDYIASVVVGGCTSSDTVKITVVGAAAPVADFAASDSTVSTIDVVTFTDSTQNLPTSWAWSFTPGTVTYQNGTSATSQNPQVIFNAPGVYTVELTATNNTGADTETKTSLITVVLGYCQPVSGTVNTVDAIAKVVITNHVPDSLVQTSTTNGVNNYDFYTTDTLELTQTTSNKIALTYSTDGNQYGAAWIDYDQNGIFEASENILLTTVSAGSGATSTANFIVPNTSTLGLTRIRFRGGSDNAYTAAGACTTSAYGETEDYLVNIVAAAACTNPPVAGAVSGSSASCPKQPVVLSLTGNTIGTTVQWQSSSDSLAWTDVAGATSVNYTDTSFTATKFYRVKVICADSSFTAGHKVSLTPLFNCYCVPLGDCALYDHLIESVTFDSIDNQYSACGDLTDQGYDFYPKSQFTTTVFASSSYNLSVLTGPGYAYYNTLAAWVDFNRNGSFDDPGEYFLIDDYAFEDTQYDISIPIPANADTGETVLRIRYAFATYLGAGDACEDITSYGGETEDYVITIKPAPVCTTPAEAGTISGPAVGLAGTNGNYVAVGADGDTYKWEFSFNQTTFTTLAGAQFNNDSITVGLGTADTVYIRVVALRPGCPNDTSARFQTIITLPGNDVCDPVALTFGANGPFINTGATAQTGEVAPPNTGFNSTQTGWANTTLSNTMWFTFVAPASGHVTIQSPDYDTQLALWDVTACGDLLDITKATLIAANDDDSAYVRHNGSQYSSFIDTVNCLVPGKTYYVQLDAYSAGGDTTRIILTDGGVTSGFTLNTTTYCTNDAPVVLLPNRPGGTFGGSGVVGSTFTPSSLAPGTYQIFYARNCDTTFKTVVINGAPSLTATSTNIACFGNASGAIDVTITGGTLPYTSVWSNGATTEDLTSVVAGTYSDTVTAANGCKAILAPVTLTQPAAALTVTLDSVVNVTCNGAANGAVYVTVTGGTGTPTFTWNAVTGSEDLTGVTGGTYTLIATDANSCSVSSGPYTIAEPAALVTVVDLVKSISCNGAGDGYINTTTTGGTTPYTYLWSNTASTDDITGLSAGSYSLVVTDAKGCTATANGTITEPTLLAVTVDSSNNISCFGNAAGDVYVTVSGGITPYTSVWSNGATTPDLENVVAGTYTDTITDANGCKVVAGPVTLTQPATGLSVALDSTVSTTCNGAANGAVYVTLTGVTGTATYTWNNVAGNEDLTSVAAGSYTLVVADGSACTATGGPYTVSQPAVLVTIVDSVHAITCNGAANGAIYTTTTGGTSPYTFIWSNTGSTDDITGLTANNYTLAVSDAKGCTSSASNNLTEPLPLTVTVDSSKDVNCFGAATGAVYTTAAGGTAPYTYVWTNSASVSGDLTGLAPNTYTVVATDTNGCTASSTPRVITGPASAISNGVDSTHDVKCNGGNTGAVFTTTTGGTTPYTYLWSNSASIEDISNLAAGTYTLVSTDSKGCKDTVSATITAPTALSVSTASTPQIGSTKGSVTTTVSGGTPAYTYAWTPGGATSPDLDTVNAGIYTVLVTDANGCTATAKDTVDFISGVNNLVSVKTLRMYPNPTMGSAVVEISLTDAQDIKLEVLDVNGHLVSTRTERNIINATFPINIAGEAAGTYLVRIHTKDGLVTKSLILQK